MAVNNTTNNLFKYFSDFDYEYENITDFTHINYSDGSRIWVRAPVWEIAIKTIAVIPIIILGLVGNSAVIFLILKIKSLRKSHVNLFILNMAIADFLTTLFNPWIALVDDIHQNYQLGPIFCRLETFMKILFLLASVLSLITISFDRFIALVFPFKSHLNKKLSYLIICTIWTLALILSCPLTIWRKYQQRRWADYLEIWCPETNTEALKRYWLFLLLTLIYIPLFVMIVIYSVIIFKMDTYEKKVVNQTPVKMKHSRTVIKMLFTYIVTTVICWIPLQIIVYYRRAKIPDEQLPIWYRNVIFIAQLLSAANSAINPIVTFRKAFSHLLPKLLKPKTSLNRVTPIDMEVIQQHLDIIGRYRSNGTGSSETRKQIQNGISDVLTSNTTTFTKQIMMKRAPELFMRDDA